MRNALLAVLMLIVVLSLFRYVPPVKASLTSGTLANAMNTIISANSWVPTTGSVDVPHYATVFSVGNPSYYQTAAQLAQYDSYPVEVLHVKRMAELDGVPSGVSDATVQSYLSSVAMAGYVPITYSGQYFLIYHRFAAGGYRWAPPSLQGKWNAAAALTQINNIVQVGMPSAPHTYIAYSQTGGYPTYYRYYDDVAETLEWFLEVGGNSYMSTCDQIWDFAQSYFWNGQYYGYNGKSGMETEVGPFATVMGRYLATKGTLGTYGNRIVSDLNQKLLISGYSSPLWNHYSLNHVPGYDERRLYNAAAAWAAMEAYYPIMTSAMQGTLQGMGAVGWKGLLDESGNFGAAVNMFSGSNGPPYTMAATGVGLMILFMNGITPVTGSLAMPLNDENYQDCTGWSPATMFNFNYASRTVKIPVNPGTLNFIFGTGTASYNFPSTGVYAVQFSNDWNTVLSANRVAGLDSSYKYIEGGSPPPPDTGTLQVTATYNGNPIVAQVQITGDGLVFVTTPYSAAVDVGDYVLVGTYSAADPATLTRYATVWNATTTSVSFPFTGSGPPPTNGTLRIFAKYANQFVPATVTVTLAGLSIPIKIGTTTTDSNNPLWFSMSPANYNVSVLYQGATQWQLAALSSGSVIDVTLDFGNNETQPSFLPYVIAVGVVAAGIVGGGAMVSRVGVSAPAPKPRRRRRYR